MTDVPAPTPATDRSTVCRICESACGLVAEVRADRVVALRPDPRHPVSRGYACRKGTRFHELQHGPERLRTPLLGGRAAGWDPALGEIGARLRGLLARHGPESVGIYSGNAAGHSFGTVLGLAGLHRGLGTTKHYSALTLDNSGMFVVLEACLGDPMRTFSADYAASDCLVLVGTDPLESQASQAQSNPCGTQEIRAAKDRLWVVDPRRSATARSAARHLPIRPGTDVHLLAWLLREALDAGRTDPWLDPRDLAELRRGLDAADPAHTGLPPGGLADLRDALLRAERPLVWCGLGVLLGPQGTVGYWLTLALEAVLGGLDRPGGWIHTGGAVDVARLGRWLGLRGRDPHLTSRIGGYRAVLGTLASATLADDILTPGEGQLRALVVVGGNPAVTLPDTERARRALASLELLVSVDLRVNETGAMAHAVLPARSWLERDEVAVHTANQRRRPHLQAVRAVVPPEGEAREELVILRELARRAGVVPFGSRVADALVARLGAMGVARLAVLLAGRVRWAELAGLGAETSPVALRDEVRVQLAAPELMAALPAALCAPAPGLVLVSSVRRATAMNTWLGDHPGPRAHPDHLAPDGSLVLEGADGRPVTLSCQPDPALPRDAVVVPFGGSAGANRLVHTRALDPITGQPVSNGLALRLPRFGSTTAATGE